MDNLTNLFNDSLHLFSLPFCLRNWLSRLRLRDNLNCINYWDLLGSHNCNLLGFFIQKENSLLGFWLLRFLGDNSKYFSELSFLRNNSLDVSFFDLLDNLLKDYWVLGLYSFHDRRACCCDRFGPLFCDGCLNCSWSYDFWNWFFEGAYDFLSLVSNNSDLFVLIHDLRDCSVSNFLHDNSEWCDIPHLSVFSLYLFNNLLKMSVSFYDSLIDYLSNNNFLNNFFYARSLNFFSFLYSLGRNNLNFSLVGFINNCNNYFLFSWSASLLNNNCSLNFILGSFCYCWHYFTSLRDWTILSEFLNNILNHGTLLNYLLVICWNNLSSGDWINFNLCSRVSGSDWFRQS